MINWNKTEIAAWLSAAIKIQRLWFNEVYAAYVSERSGPLCSFTHVSSWSRVFSGNATCANYLSSQTCCDKCSWKRRVLWRTSQFSAKKTLEGLTLLLFNCINCKITIIIIVIFLKYLTIYIYFLFYSEILQ